MRIVQGYAVVMQGHYVAKAKATGKSVRATVAHVLEISDGKIVRFDRYVDSATINAIIAHSSRYRPRRKSRITRPNARTS